MRKLKPGYAAINRNLLNFPWARDPRVMTDWRRSDKLGCWLCDLPGNPDIQFRLPLDVKTLHCPDPFDMNMLFVVLREARCRKSRRVRFGSRSEFIEALGLATDNIRRHRRRLDQALRLWSSLSIRYRHWYQAVSARRQWKHGVRGKHVRKTLPPPLKLIGSPALVVEVDRRWCELWLRYYRPVALPLPMNAPAQNLVLLILTSAECDKDVKFSRPIRTWCRAIGLNHSTRNEVFDHAVRLAQDWFAKHGIRLEEIERNGRLCFILSTMEEQKPRPKGSLPRHRLHTPIVEPEKEQIEEWVDDNGRRGWQKLVEGEWVECAAPRRF